MGFAQPLALLFLGLSAPIILLYFLRQRRRRVQVSTLLFFEEVIRDEDGAATLARLRKVLSLLLQLLFVGLLAFALSRPYHSEHSGAARRLVVLVDVSASMMVEERGASRLEHARARARGVFLGMSSSDSGMLISVGREARVLAPFTNQKDELLDGVKSLEQSHAPADFGAASAVLDTLPADDRKTYVYWITDNATGSFAQASSDDVERIQVPVGEARENVGITSFSSRPLPGSPRDVEMLIEVVNETDVRQRLPYELRVNDVVARAAEWTLEPGEHRIETLRQYNQKGGALELYIEFEDAFPLDNRAYAVLPAPTRKRVLLVTEGNPFLASALRTIDGVEVFRATPEKYEELYGDGTLPAEIELVVFDRAAIGTVPKTDAVFIGAWPESLVSKSREIPKPLITDWTRDHPILANLTLSDVSIERALGVEVAQGWEALVHCFNDPIMFLRETSDVKQLLISFDIGSSNLPLRSAFPILIANIVQYTTMDHGGPSHRTVPVGTTLTLDDLRGLSPQLETLEKVAIVAPGRDASTILLDASTILLDDTTPLVADRVGIYSFESAEGVKVPLFAVNLTDRSESRLNARRSEETSGDLIPDEGRLDVQPWTLLTALGLVLILVEWVLFQRRLVE